MRAKDNLLLVALVLAAIGWLTYRSGGTGAFGASPSTETRTNDVRFCLMAERYMAMSDVNRAWWKKEGYKTVVAELPPETRKDVCPEIYMFSSALERAQMRDILKRYEADKDGFWGKSSDGQRARFSAMCPILATQARWKAMLDAEALKAIREACESW